MNRSWYDRNDWYQSDRTELRRQAETAAPPAEQEGEISPVETAPKGRRLTPSRIIALILALLVLISATSVAFSRGGTAKKTDSIFDSEEDELPENAWDFFSQYYEDVQSDHVEVNLKEAESRAGHLPIETFVVQRARDYFEEWADEALAKADISDLDSYLKALYNKINRIEP